MTNEPAPYDHARAVTASAEAAKAAIQEAGVLGRYLGDVLGSAPHELMNVVTMHIREFKIRTAIRLYSGTKRRLKEAGLDMSQLQPPTASIEVPLLEAAFVEDRKELAELWEKLLAAAIAPSSRDRVRARHIEILRSLEPLDAWLLQNFDRLVPLVESNRKKTEKAQNMKIMGEPSENEYIAAAQADRDESADEFQLSFDALLSIGLLSRNSLNGIGKTATARAFLAIVNTI